ncbi:LamG-like jellyroll fold domain-containing protein [Streptomyces rochei]|uniref:LamG-like jellyroll fold domain-containing protein n=1 Tax=Streptomyces rochei TaxID=1928 RepID=UPI00368B0542
MTPEVRGFDAKRSREVASARNEQERTYLNPDGTYTTRFYNEPVNFRKAKGSWQPIDTTLKPLDTVGPGTMNAGGEGWETTATEEPIEFAGTADADPVVRIRVGDGMSVAYGVSDARAVAGQAEGSTVTYPDARTGADLEFIAGGDSVKETLVLKEASAPTTWRFPLTLEGLTAAIDDHGGVVFTDADGKVRAWTPAGWMQDSNLAPDSNEGVISSGVTYSLEVEDGRQVLVVALDKEWLASPERVFPVRVDPSVKSVDATSGTYVQYPYNQNFASDTVLKVGTYDGGGHKAAAFLRFSGLETTLKNAWVLGANLALYNTWSLSCSARPVTVHPITSNWSESTTATYPGPSTGASLASKSFAHGWRPSGTTAWSCGPAWESIRLGSAGRKLVDDWTHGRKKNYGLAVKASTSDSRGWKQFGSDDYPNGKPSLDVTWTKYGATYKLGDFTAPVTATSEGVQKVTVTNQGQETWTAGSNYKLRYNLFDAAGKEITDFAKIRWTPMPQDISPGETVTLDAKIAPLAPATYTVQWTMDEGGVGTFVQAGVPGPAVKIASVNIPPQLTAESPGSGVTVDTLTPTLWAKGTDADRYPKSTLQYSFEVCEVEGSNLRKNCKTGPRVSGQQWAVPSGWLSWSKSYAWYGYAYDGAANSARPGPALLTTQVPQPTVTSHLGGSDSGKEIGTRAGNYVTAATDAAITTVGPELAVTRTYNSLDPRRDGAFGEGWSTRWDMRIRQEPETSTVLVTLADGAQVRFGTNPDGTYAGPAGGGITRTRQPEGWTMRERSGATYYFLASGALETVTDSAGRVQRLTHDPANGGRLRTVTDVMSGRSLTFAWSGDHVSAVTTSAVDADTPGLTWKYTYTGDRLTKVCPPASTTKCTLYEYETGSVYRSGVLDAGPASYWRLGEREGSAAVSEAVSRTGQDTAVYRDVQMGTDSAVAGTTDTSVAFDGTDSAIELPFDTLKGAAFPAIELWFKTSTPSGVLVGLQDEQLGDTPHSWRPVLNIDGAGKLRGEFYLAGASGATPIVSTQPVTDGRWHHAVLTSGATRQSLFLDGVLVGSLNGPLIEQGSDYAYLGAGYASVGWNGLAAGTYRFKGQMDEVAIYNHPLDRATINEHYAARTAIGQMGKTTLPSGRVHATATYDRGTGRLTEHTDNNGGTWKVAAPAYSTASSSYASAIQRSGPTGYWRLGERSGAQALSPLGDGLPGSYLESVRLGSAGIFSDGDDTAAAFTGDGAMEVPVESLGTRTSMSLELWFKTSEPGGVLVSNQNAPFGETPDSGWTPMLLIGPDGKLRGRFSFDANALLSRESVTDNKWHHVLLTGNEGIQALFLDGDYQGSTQTGVDTLRFTHAFVGSGYASPGWDGQAAGYRNFTGQIDEVAFYDKPLVQFQKVTSSEGRVSWRYIPYPPVGGYTDTPNSHIQARKALVEGTGDQYQGVAVADAPAAYWRLGEAEGTTLRSEVGGPDMSATYRPEDSNVGYSRLDRTGVFGVGDDRAVDLGSTGHIEIPGSLPAASTDLSAELWFKTSTPSAVLMSFQNAPIGQTPTSWHPVLNIDGDGKLRGEFFVAGGATPITSAQSVTDGKWHHAVLTAAGTTQYLYLDGVRIGSVNGTLVDHAAPYAYIGGGYSSPGWMGQPENTYYFRGTIDEVAFYRGSLSADQVSAHYRAQAETASSGLTATVSVTDPKGQTSSTSYDALHGQRKVSHRDETGAVTSYAYDSAGNLHTVTDPNGHTAVTGHDARGNAVSATSCRDADSCWTSFTSYHLNADDPLDPRNDKPLAYRDQRSTDAKDSRFRTQYTYNSLGLPTTVVRPDSSTASTTYTTGTEAAVSGGTAPAGLVSTQTTAGGAKTSYRYFANGDLAETSAPSGLVTAYTYDGLGRKTSETQVSDTFPNGVSTTYGYDTASNVVAESGVGVKNEITGTTHTAKITRSYDEDGNLLSETTTDTTGSDPARTTTYQYNARGLNSTVIDAEQNTTRYEYDELGQAIGMSNAAGTHFTYSYTPRGQHATTVLDDWSGDPSGTVRDLTVVSNAYDPAGRLASTTDAMGATTAYTYFDDGLPATTTARQVTQADGSRHDILLESNTYDPAGNLTKQVTGGGATTQTYTVDALGRTTTSVLDPGGLNRTSTFTYDGDDRIKQATQSITGDKKLATTSVYDTAGNLTQQTVTDGTTTRTTTSTYDDRGLPLTTVSPRGNAPGADPSLFTTSYRYDALGRLVQETAPQVQVEKDGTAATTVRPTTLTGYNTFGESTETRDARGNVTRTQVDLLGRTTAITLPGYTPPGTTTALTATTRTTYTPLGQPQTVTDPLGRVTRYGYDQLGQLTSTTDPVANAADALAAAETEPGLLLGPSTSAEGGGVTHHTWTPTGLQLSTTDPTGARTEATYDELGRQLTATTVERYPAPQNLTTRYTWDDAGNQTASTTPAGVTTTSTYNPAGEVLSVTDPAGTTRFRYDGLGRQTETTDATNRRTTTTYDTLGNPTATTDYGTGTTALRTRTAEFDADGNLTAAISPQTKARTTYTYDALGRMTQQVEPVSPTASITTTFGYDAAGNRTRLTDGRGNKTVYTFNSWGLPESTIEPPTTAHPDAADRTWTTSYDKAGQAITEHLPGGVKRHSTYDGLGRLIHEAGTGAEATTADRTLSYDLAGRLTSVGVNGPLNPNTYTYNDRGQLLAADGPSGTVRYTYDADGNMTERTDAKNTTSYGYGPAGRLEWLWNEMTGADIWYSWDAAGRPLMEQYAIQPEGSTEWTESARRSYGYDSLGRLTDDIVTTPDEQSQIAATTYAYDLDDQLTWKDTSGTAGAGEHVYGYDQAGRMSYWTHGDTTTHYTWDAAGNRTKAGTATATYDARNRLLTDGSTAYAYTPRGTLSTVTTGTTARSLTFDAFERKITDGTSTYTYDSLDRVAQHGTTTFRYDGGSNNLLGDGTTNYTRTPAGALLASSNDTTTQWSLTDQHSDLVAGLSTDGLQVTGSTAYGPFGTTTATDGNMPDLGYQSGWTDPANGNVNMAARWYQPGTGSFTSRDTWQLNPSPSARANRYGYGIAAPLLHIDPSGHDVIAPGRTRVPYSGSSGGWYTSSGWGQLRSAASWGWRWGKKRSAWGMILSTALQGWSDSSVTSAWRGITRPDPNGTGRTPRRPSQPGFKWALVDTGNGNRGGASSVGYLSSSGGRGGRGGGSGCSRTCTVTPPPPPIDQNPNNGSNPVPAPTRPKPKPDYEDRSWSLGDALNATVSAQAMIDLVGITAFIPSEALSPNALLGEGRRPGMDSQNRGDCRRAGEGWVEYGQLDSAHGNRATGVQACLDRNYLDTHKGSSIVQKVKPPGYLWAKAYVGYLGGLDPTRAVNACHLLGSDLTGSGTDLRNLATCSRQANTAVRGDGRINDHMFSYESQVKEAVKNGQVVHYTVTPKYSGARTVPVSFEISARGIMPDGSTGIAFSQPVPNSVYSPRKGWRNMGTVTDSRSGLPVPTGPLP